MTARAPIAAAPVARAASAVVAFAVATIAVAAAFADEPSPLWDDVAHPNRHTCALLTQEGLRFKQARQAHAATLALRKASALCPGDRVIAEELGMSLLDEHDYAPARRSLEHARALADDEGKPSPRDVWLAFYLGYARELTGDLDGAIVEHRRLESLGGLPSPDQYLTHYNLGDELMAVGRLKEAIEEYRRAVVLAPDKSMPRLALAVALDRQGELDKSRESLNVALSIDPQLRHVFSDEYVFVPAADSHYYLALGLLARGRIGEARVQLRAFRAALPSGPYDAQAAERLAAAEHVVDPRELEASTGALEISDGSVDRRPIARALSPIVAELEACIPAAQEATRLKLLLTANGLRADPAEPANECLEPLLAHVSVPKPRKNTWIIVPLAGRRALPPAR